MIRRVTGLVQELRGDRATFHPSTQQETRGGIVLRFLGWPCECETEEVGGCVYPGLGWRCGHRRLRMRETAFRWIEEFAKRHRDGASK